ncbi:MAG: biotin-dependent carboxyltransferase family protein [Acidobacteriota bacterium]
MSLYFQTNSLLATIQDLGRNGFRSLGINPNGAMDKTAVRLINILLGNNENEAVLEIHFPTPKILFKENALVALGGADFGAKIDEVSIENWQTVWVEKGQALQFTQKNSGNRLYLSVKGGFKINEWLGSKSTNLKAKLGGFEGRNLQKDDEIEFKVKNQKPTLKKYPKISQYSFHYSTNSKIRILEGFEFGLLTPLSSENFLRQKFTITQNSDRMGFRLESEPLYLMQEKELVSSAVDFGTIQLLPNGQLIVLMADHQTTGGYPRIGNVISVDLPFLAQKGVNETIGFEIISLEEVENLALKFERDLNFLKTAIKFQF